MCNCNKDRQWRDRERGRLRGLAHLWQEQAEVALRVHDQNAIAKAMEEAARCLTAFRELET